MGDGSTKVNHLEATTTFGQKLFAYFDKSSLALGMTWVPR
jgi:hypothetical protein